MLTVPPGERLVPLVIFTDICPEGLIVTCHVRPPGGVTENTLVAEGLQPPLMVAMV
jgi:hypothetical protein